MPYRRFMKNASSVGFTEAEVCAAPEEYGSSRVLIGE
jgi:hypothetical protein